MKWGPVMGGGERWTAEIPFLSDQPVRSGSEAKAAAPMRWIILAAIFLLSFSAFIERLTLSVVAERMMPELGITQVQIGWLFSAFVVGYTFFQFPGGLLGLRFGARRVLLWSSMLGAVAGMGLVLMPAVAAGASMIALLLASRFLLGVVQAPLYPVSSGALVAWFPPSQWAWSLGLLVTGIGLGAAVTPPAVAWMMQVLGWRIGVCVATLPGLIAAAIWWRFGRDRPGPAVESAVPHRAVAAGSTLWRDALFLVTDRDVVALTISYLLDNAVVYLITFWSFLYLVQVRHFTVLQGGGLAAIPFFVGAGAAAVGGRWCDRCCQRVGVRWGVRIIPLIALPSVAVLLYLAVRAPGPFVAVAALTGCYSGLQMTEGSYWSATMRVGKERTMAATGVLNTGGNLGGVVITPVVGYLTAMHSWTPCFLIAAACAIVSAGLWLFIDPTRNQQPERGALHRPRRDSIEAPGL
jgi:MFS transporter, ACS family, glucarate transporter